MYFEHSMSLDEISSTLEKLENIKSLFELAKKRKSTVENYLHKTFQFQDISTKCYRWLKNYPKLVERLERMFQHELHKLVDLEFTCKKYKNEILDFFDDDVLFDHIKDDIESYVDDVCKVRYSESEMRGE